MISILATFSIKEGKGPEFEAFFLELAAKVKANEPGCLTYQLVRHLTDPTIYKVVEFYRDDEAIKAHGQSEYFKAANPRFPEFMADRVQIERFVTVD